MSSVNNVNGMKRKHMFDHKDYEQKPPYTHTMGRHRDSWGNIEKL